MRRILIATSFLLLFGFATVAAACEKCGIYFDYQTGSYCKYCIQNSACGYFQCEISYGWGGMETCGSAWDAPGDDACFTEYGASHNMCGPEQQVLATPPSELRLVSARITTSPVRARGGRHQKG